MQRTRGISESCFFFPFFFRDQEIERRKREKEEERKNGKRRSFIFNSLSIFNRNISTRLPRDVSWTCYLHERTCFSPFWDESTLILRSRRVQWIPGISSPDQKPDTFQTFLPRRGTRRANDGRKRISTSPANIKSILEGK